jgi:hypothetical protein
VFETDTRSISYTIVEGHPIYVGEGQHYDRSHEKHKVTIQLIDPELYADGQEGVPKSLKFYLIPNDNFFVRTKGKRKTIHNAINEDVFYLFIYLFCFTCRNYLLYDYVVVLSHILSPTYLSVERPPCCQYCRSNGNRSDNAGFLVL